METFEAIKKRVSVRAFSEKPVSREDLEKIIDAGRLAPTARGIQPWEFVVVTERGALKKMGELADTGRFLAQAAAAIAVFCQDVNRYLEDGSAATENMLLAATALGIGSCWVAGDRKPYAGAISQLLGAPASHKLVCIIALGYPKSEVAPKPKRPLSQVLHWEKF